MSVRPGKEPSRPASQPAFQVHDAPAQRKPSSRSLTNTSIQAYHRLHDVELTPEAARQLDHLPLVIRVRVLGILERLARWPNVSGAQPLSGRLAGRRRIRTGNYRVQFRVAPAAIIVERIGHRNRFCEE